MEILFSIIFTVFWIYVLSIKSSASRGKIYFPFAIVMPKFLASEGPRFSFVLRIVILGWDIDWSILIVQESVENHQ